MRLLHRPQIRRPCRSEASALGAPMAMVRSTRPYWSLVDSRWSITCCTVDCRTYTTASRSRCCSPIFSERDLGSGSERRSKLSSSSHGAVVLLARVAIRRSRSLPSSATRRLRFGGGSSSQVGGDFFSRGGGNCSLRHAARSCGSVFREVLSLCASSTIPNSPASAMIGCAGGFACTGVLWLGD